jgi:hypothetical protein
MESVESRRHHHQRLPFQARVGETGDMIKSKSNVFDVFSAYINTAHDPRPMAPCRNGMDRPTRVLDQSVLGRTRHDAVVERLPLEALARDS